MRKFLSFFLAINILIVMFVPSYASDSKWDLSEEPDFTGYVLNDYWDLESSDTVVIETGEADFTVSELEALTSEFLRCIDDVEFVHGEYADYKAEDIVILAYFVKSDWKTDTSTDIIHIYITNEGICYEVWERATNEEHCAFIECSTDNIIEKVRNVMAAPVEKIEAKRAEEDVTQKEETSEENSKDEILLTSFERYAYVNANDIDLYGTSNLKVTVDFEMGICSYKVAENNKETYAFYFNLGEEPNKYFICDNPDGNLASYTDLSVYKATSGKNQGKYCVYGEESTASKFETDIKVNESGQLEEIRVSIKHSGFEGVVEKSEFTQTGVFNTYGNLRIEKEKAEIDASVSEDTDLRNDESKNEEFSSSEENEFTEKKEEPLEREEKAEVKEPEQDEEVNKEEKNEEIVEKDKTEHNTYAEALYKLGLFRGTENGFDLDASLTRAQGATMIVRLLGKENESLNLVPKGVFSDVATDNWAAPYIEYCSNNLITKGTGNNKYSPDASLSGSQYMTLVLRALDYVDSEPDTAESIAYGCNLLSAEEAYSIARTDILDRRTMVYVSYRALSATMKSGDPLIEKLVENRAVNKDIAQELGFIK